MFRPDQLGLPGQLPPGLPEARPAPPAPVPDDTTRWAWGLLAVGLIAALAVGGVLFLLRADSNPDVVAGTLPATSTIPAAAPATPIAPTATPAPEATATPAAAPATASTAATPAEPTPGSTPSPPPGAAVPSDAPTSDLPPFVPEEEGFLLSDSGGQERLPAPVASAPAPAWTTALPGDVVGVTGDEDLVAVAVDTDTGGRLDAVELDTGEPRWSTPLAGGLSAPVVAGETVVVLQRTEGSDARVVGLDRQTGKEVWSTTTPDNGGLFAVLLDDGGVLLGDIDRVDRLDPLTGELTALVSGELLRRGSDAVAAYTDGTVRVVDLADGTPRDERFVGPIGEDGDFVFTDERVVVFDGETIWSINTVGQREWDFTPTEDAAQVRHMVLVPGGTLLASFAGGDGTVALDVETGEVRWRSPVPVDLTGAFDGVLRGAGATSPVQLVDLLDGSDVGSFLDLGGSGNPFANGLYYAVTDDGLTAYQMADGQRLWAVAADELLDRHAIPGGIVLTNADDTITLLR
ncbi:PQQ-binding-like beta-propeller repeat protein [Euzebya pacifica]|uniref:outer membrane protein assembly factor BamB family protein n=1 Tax=Euzebya pacifica TaxID=1608957 RepID=UPI0030FB0428